MGPDVEVLVVGAGPTGLVLALWLARAGVRVRVVDQAAGPGTTSRATVVHARTLELYRQLGIADEVVAAGVPLAEGSLWARGRRLVRIPFRALGAGVSPYPFILSYPQDAHEALLLGAVERVGVRVERRTALLGFDETPDGVVARLRGPDGRESTCAARYLAGCDGARSVVRRQLGDEFPGGTYTGVYFVADVTAEGPAVDGGLHVVYDAADFMLAFPMRGAGRMRLVGQVRRDADPAGAADDGAPPLTWDDVRAPLAGRLGVRVREVRWFSTYRVHHRVAARFRRDSAFLLGDAAHLHSPVGGQGMNTGIGDAVNLAWKLAAVLRGRAAPLVLDSYEPERRAFAERLVATTDRAFEVVTAQGWLAEWVRTSVVPLVLPLAFRLPAARRLAFRTLSQTAIAYPDSPLSRGRAGGVSGGDRLPWVPLADADNYAPLAARDWQLHVYGDPAPAVCALCAERDLPLHAFPWRADMSGTGLRRGAAYLVRPDGYVGLADGSGAAESIAQYLDALGIRPAHLAGRTA